MHATIIKNETTNTFHPCPFRISPRPSDDTGFVRHKSIGHHTNGFSTLELAKEHIVDQKWKWDGTITNWDGNGVPALIRDYKIDEFF